MDTENTILLEGVSFSYDNQPVLTDVNLQVRNREFVWVVGPNGGGKTTLVKLILGLLKPSSGSVKVFGKTPSAARKQIGYMPQQVYLDLLFPVTVLDVALMGRLGSGRGLGTYSKRDRELTHNALELVDLADKSGKLLRELSGGEKRRLLIARALAAEADLLILDEPTANLDRQVERELYDVLRTLNEHLTIVLISHDPAFVSDFVETVVCVNRTVSIHPTSVLESDLVGDLYAREMRIVRHGHKEEGN